MPLVKHQRLFSQTLTTKRGVVSGVRRTAPTAHITDPVRCSRVIPLDSTAQQESFARGISVDLQIFCDPADILPEDVITVEGSDYVAVEVSLWPGRIVGDVLQVTLREYQEP